MRLYRFDGDEQPPGTAPELWHLPEPSDQAPQRPKTIDISNAIGKVEVILPDNIPVDVNCAVTIGETICPRKRKTRTQIARCSRST